MSANIPPLDVLWQIPLWPEEWAAVALNMSEEQIKTYRLKQGLPASYIGKHPYYLRDEVLAWFSAQRR